MSHGPGSASGLILTATFYSNSKINSRLRYFYQSLFDNISMCRSYLCIEFCFNLQINIASFNDEFEASMLSSNNSRGLGQFIAPEF